MKSVQNAHPNEVAEQIRQARIIPILRIESGERVVDIAKALLDAGFSVIEITTDHTHSVRSIAAVKEALAGKVTLGAGTVVDPRMVYEIAAAGAEFCLSPHLDAAVVGSSLETGLLPIPGVFTPTEIVNAQRLGLNLLKLFPCGGIQPGYLEALRGPFAPIGFIPTGGIRIETVASWLEAGAAAVGMGSSLVKREGYDSGLPERAARLRTLVNVLFSSEPAST